MLKVICFQRIKIDQEFVLFYPDRGRIDDVIKEFRLLKISLYTF